jgi:DNA-binding beta-propeller fold protein YncE
VPNRTRLIACGAAFVFVLVAACSSEPRQQSRSTPQGKPARSPASEEPLPKGVFARVDTGAGSNFLGAAGGYMWLSETDEGTVAAIDPGPNQVADRVKVGGAPDFLSVGFGDVWVSSSAEGTIVRIDPATMKVVARGRVGRTAFGSNPGFGSMWVADHDGGRLYQLDPKDATPVGSVKVPAAADVVAAFGSLWVAGETGKAYEIDPHTLTVRKVVRVDAAHAIAAAFGSIWVSAGGEADTVTRIDPGKGKVIAEIETDVAGFPDRMAPLQGFLWVGQYQAPEILGIDPRKNEITHRRPAGGGAAVVAPGFGDLWVANFDDGDVWRLDVP